jgi:hypothetical protein
MTAMDNNKSERHPAEPEYIVFSPLRNLLSFPKQILWNIKRRMLCPPGTLESWFVAALERQNREGELGFVVASRSYYEFGVGWGGTLMQYIKALNLFCRENSKNFYEYRIFGFDSFEGLPEKKGFQDSHPAYWKGAFSHSIDEISEKVRRYGVDLKQGNIQFIKGFFEDSLTSELRDKLRKWPPSIVTIDVDYYSSTKTVLEWLRPILPSGALFYFDNIWDFHGHPDYGELGAINEFNNRCEGQLVPLPVVVMAGRAYIFSRKDFEYENKKSKR